MRKAIIGLLFAMSTTMALSTTYYTAPTGKVKNTGTSVNHPLDINTAFERLSNGDTLYCVGGQYNLNKTLVLNVENGLIRFLLEHSDSADAELICRQLYDTALLTYRGLSAQEMTDYITRTNELLERVIR